MFDTVLDLIVAVVPVLFGQLFTSRPSSNLDSAPATPRLPPDPRRPLEKEASTDSAQAELIQEKGHE